MDGMDGWNDGTGRDGAILDLYWTGRMDGERGRDYIDAPPHYRIITPKPTKKMLSI